MNLIGYLAYGIYALKNFISSRPWIHQNTDKKFQTELNVFGNVIANSLFLVLYIKETFLSSVVSKTSG